MRDFLPCVGEESANQRVAGLCFFFPHTSKEDRDAKEEKIDCTRQKALQLVRKNGNLVEEEEETAELTCKQTAHV